VKVDTGGPPGPPGADGADGADGTPAVIPLEPWHLIGQPGEPAFQNGAGNYGGGFNPAGFRKFPDGKVKLKGLVNAPNGVAMFTLPAGYLPPATGLYVSEGNSAIGRVDVGTNGQVVATLATTLAWYTLDHIEFDTETVTEWLTGPRGPKGRPGAGGIASTQRKMGVAGAYLAVTPEAVLSDGAGMPMQLSITPDDDMWWEVTGDIGLVQKLDAAYNYMCGYIDLHPADQDGVVNAYCYVTQHSQVQTMEPRHVQRLFRLAAGETYWVYLRMGNSDGGSWQYYAGPSQLSLTAKGWYQ